MKKKRKKDAYAILLDKYRNRYPEANREYVTKKRNSLRANFKKDMKRIDNSEKKWRRYRKCFVFFFAFTQKANVMATQAASVSLIMSEPQLMAAQGVYWPRPTSFILHLASLPLSNEQLTLFIFTDSSTANNVNPPVQTSGSDGKTTAKHARHYKARISEISCCECS